MSEIRPRRSTSIGSGSGGGGGGGSSSSSGTRKGSSPRPVKPAEQKEKNKGSPSSGAGSALRRREFLLRSNLSMDASCSSDASSDSFCSRASTGRIGRRLSLSGGSTISSYTSGLAGRRSNSFSQPGKGKLGAGMGPASEEMAGGKRRCAWITANTGTYFDFNSFFSFCLPIYILLVNDLEFHFLF
jgi:DNA-3-methyladenine glycosylase I